jgi:serine/threonine protein phosphatase PrpC
VCAEPLEAEDRFCGHCGHDVTAPPPTAASSAASAAAPAAPAQRAAGSPPESSGAAGAAGGDGTAGEDGSDHDSDAFRIAPPGAAGAAPPGPSGPAAPEGAAAAESGGDAAGGSGTGGHGTGGPGAGGPDAGGHGFGDDGGADTLVLGVPTRMSDPREEEPAVAEPGPVCVACGVGGVDEDGYCEHCGHAQPRQRDHQEKELEGVAAVSDRGLRHHRNEDAFAVAAASLPDGTPAVSAVVCDGVSTAYRPDDASAVASAAGSESLLQALERGASAEDAMRGALMAAFDAVTALADEEPAEARVHRNAPACTCVSAVVTGPVFTVGWIGDSRAYWIPDDRALPPARLTEDDSWAARMVSAGLMSEAEAYADERAHAITGWLGADAVEVDPHVAAFQPDGPGVIVVCTDGLWNYAESAAEMAEAVPRDARARPLATARALLGLALDGGGHDNVTVAVLPFPAAVSRAGSPSA